MNNLDMAQFEPGIVRSIWRYRWVFLLFVFAFTALGLVSVYLLEQSDDTWSASAVLVVEDPRASALFDRTAQPQGRYVANQVAILRSTPVAERAAELLDAEGVTMSPEDVLLSSDVIATTGSSEVIEIAFRGDSEAAAMAGANAIAQAYQDVRRSEARSNYQSSLDQLDAFLGTTDGRLTEIQEEIDALSETDTRVALQARLDGALQELIVLSESQTASLDDIEALRGEIDALELAVSIVPDQDQIDLLRQERENLSARLARLTERRDEIAIDSELLGSGVLLSSPAASATPPASTSPLRNTALGFVVGAALGAAAAYFMALRRRTFSAPAQPALVLNAPLLASVPNFREERLTSDLPIRDAPGSAAAEGFRFALAAIRLRYESPAHHPDGVVAGSRNAETPKIAIVSASAGDGKTVVAANTALAAANDGLRVLLIDADVADQGISNLLLGSIADRVALELASGNAIDAAVIEGAHSGVVHLVGFPSAGGVDPGRFASDRLPTLLLAAEGRYDLVVVDVPPLLHIAYASTIAQLVGVSIVVVGHGGRVAEVEDEKSRLDLSGTELAGYVYTKAPLREDAAVAGSLRAHRAALQGEPPVSKWSEVADDGRNTVSLQPQRTDEA